MKKLAILASGSGTNAENIHNFFSRGRRIGVDLVIYDRKDAGVAQRMQAHGVETVYIPASVWRESPEKILAMLRERGIDLVVLAGFLRMVPQCITRAYDHRILNIHPSLLPAYGGKGMFGRHVHEAVIANRETKSGVTVHYVTDVCDGGEIVMQQEVEVTPDDTAETLEAKIHPVEYALYPRAIVRALDAIADKPTPEPDSETETLTDTEAETVIETETETIAATEMATEAQQAAATPPPTPAEEWADALGVSYCPEAMKPKYSSNPHIAAQGSTQQPQQPVFGGVPYPNMHPNMQPGMQPNMQPGMQPNMQPGGNNEMPPMPPTYLIWAVIMTVCCCFIPGIVAIIMSTRVSSKYYAGDYEGAKRASETTAWWVIASFVLGIMTATLYLPLSLLFN